ncbi:MAG: urease accessory protein UreE [Deltaproteobacteria bacterium]|jgi:urease accessory protein UreF/urease accessory protein UreE|nr:urease accessory protein UreE [Deltaproteobacteria bacterium]
MLKLTENLGRLPESPSGLVLPLDSASRRRPRQRARLADGREAAVLLARGTVMAPGDVLRAESGELATVAAAPEPLSEALAPDWESLARAAYHLGNRHAELELGKLWARFPEDGVLEDLVRGLGLSVRRLTAPFLPEGGAYGGNAHAHSQEHSQEHSQDHFRDHHNGSGRGSAQGRINAGAPFGLQDPARGGARAPGRLEEGGARESFPEPAAAWPAGAGKLLRLLYAASPARPTGAFAWSGGLASFVAEGEVKDAAGLKAWISDAASLSHARCDLPALKRCFLAALAGDEQGFARWNEFSLASRGTRELLLGERETGGAVMRLLEAAGLLAAFPEGFRREGVGYVAAYGLMGASLGLAKEDAPSLLTAFLWGAAENYALCAAKSIPLGQSAVQAALLELLGTLPQAVSAAMGMADDEVGASAPLLAVRSCSHEGSLLRMFRS